MTPTQRTWSQVLLTKVSNALASEVERLSDVETRTDRMRDQFDVVMLTLTSIARVLREVARDL